MTIKKKVGISKISGIALRKVGMTLRCLSFLSNLLANMFIKNQEIKKQFFLFNLIIVFLFLFAFEAQADLVDDIIKEHKLDPRNNPKDQ